MPTNHGTMPTKAPPGSSPRGFSLPPTSASTTPLTSASSAPGNNHPPGDATLIDTLRRIVADRQYAKIDGVLVDVWSASVTVLIWDRLRDDKRQRLLTLPSHELILRCIAIYTRLSKNGGGT